MISSNDELYGAVKSIIEVLRLSGDPARARVIADAMAVSTVPGEVLGAIRAELRALEDCPEVELGREIEDALVYLDSIL